MVTTKPDSSKSHVLIVNSNYDESRLLVGALRSKGYRVSIAFAGAEGYGRAVANVPDLILLDAYMPEMDGFATYRKFKANPSLARIPVIFLGVSYGASERLIALETGAADYILRPYAPEEVLIKVHRHLVSGEVMQASSKPSDFSGLNLDVDQVLVRAAQQYLVENIANVPSLGYFAQLLGTNEKRLSRAFQKCLAMTVFDYLRQERMRTAQRLLQETALSIVAISEEVGFSRATNFSTAFRGCTGMSPSEFRKMAMLHMDVMSPEPGKGHLSYQRIGATSRGFSSRHSGVWGSLRTDQ